MDSDPHNNPIDNQHGQAELLLERLESLRGELGAVGEELITLLRDAGITPPADSEDHESKAGYG